MQFETWEDAVKKAKAMTAEKSSDVVPDPDSVPPVLGPARPRLPSKTSAIALCVLVVFAFGFLASLVFMTWPDDRPAVGVRPSSTTPEPGGISRTVSEPAYTILDFDGDRANPLRKDIYVVRLREKVAKDILRGLADEIRRKGSTAKERTIIWFYLPQVDAFKAGPFGAPWALADFDPGLKLEVYGLNAEQEAELAASPIPPGRHVVGRWIEDCNGGEGLYSIYRKDGVLYLETMGGRPTEGIITELTEAGLPAGRRFERKKVSGAGDHYLINHKGDLELRDNKGLISVCKKVQ